MNRLTLFSCLAVAVCGGGLLGCSEYHHGDNSSTVQQGQHQGPANRELETTGKRLPSEWPLPNPDGGIPLNAYFYTIDDHYPAYLLCSYDIDDVLYNQTKEAERFRASLSETRQWGRGRFPPVKWVAVIICNRAEHKNAATFEQSFKVGAVFKADDVFNPSINLERLVSQSEKDRHPFKFGPQLAPYDADQRRLIVEQHAAANHSTTDLK